jgi:hypothetical protein
MRPKARFSIVAAAFLVVACATPRQETATDAAIRWPQQVVAISAGNDTAARGDAIKSRLSSLGLNPREKAFIAGEHKGSNLLADIGGSAGTPLPPIGAHCDRVGVGPGATDNASGSTAVMELAEAFVSRPLGNHPAPSCSGIWKSLACPATERR